MPTRSNAKYTAAPTDEVAVAAYLDWVAAGKPSGRDDEFWLKAEDRLRNGKSNKSAAPKPARAAMNAAATKRVSPAACPRVPPR